MRVLRVGFNCSELELSMKGPKGKERLQIRGGYPDTPLSQQLFSQLGLMHLVAPYLPPRISTDFRVLPEIKKLIGAMYRSEDHKPPTIQMPNDEVEFMSSIPQTESNRAVVAYSAGKDSMWNMWWAQEKYGPENVMAVHISGLNRNNGSNERDYSLWQKEELGFKNFQIIDLLNSSQNTGYEIMRSRDMFLSGIMIPQTLEFGASKIITEGFAEEKPTEPFSGQSKNMRYFNTILHELGIPVRVSWRDKKEMGIIKDLLVNRPDWLSYVHNCFSAACFKVNTRRSWERNAPTFPLYKSQCGSCPKCRITNLARVLYDSTMNSVRVKDIEIFLKTTVKWVRDRRIKLADLLEGSFVRDLKKALRKYGLDLEI